MHRSNRDESCSHQIVISIPATSGAFAHNQIVILYSGGFVFKIIDAEFLAPAIKRFIIEAPRIARKQKPGQFVILRVYEEGERIPITIESSDPARGTISIVVQSVGKTTHLLNSLQAGNHILDVVGPFGTDRSVPIWTSGSPTIQPESSDPVRAAFPVTMPSSSSIDCEICTSSSLENLRMVMFHRRFVRAMAFRELIDHFGINKSRPRTGCLPHARRYVLSKQGPAGDILPRR